MYHLCLPCISLRSRVNFADKHQNARLLHQALADYQSCRTDNPPRLVMLVLHQNRVHISPSRLGGYQTGVIIRIFKLHVKVIFVRGLSRR